MAVWVFLDHAREALTDDGAEDAQVHPGPMNWARLLKRVFDIDMQHCPNYGAGEFEVIDNIPVRWR